MSFERDFSVNFDDIITNLDPTGFLCILGVQ